MYDTLHQLYKLEKGGGPVSQESMTRRLKWVINLKMVQVRAAIAYHVCRGKLEKYMNVWFCVIMLEDGVWQACEDRTLSLDVRCQKCTDLRSNYRRFKLEMYVPCTQWLRKSLHSMQCLLCRYWIKAGYKRPFWSLQTIYGHKNTAREPVLTWKDDIVPLLYPAFSFEAPVWQFLSMMHCQGKSQ